MKIVCIWTMAILWWLSNLILKPRKLSCQKVYKLEEKRGKFSSASYKATIKMVFDLPSDFGYKISCEQLEPNQRLENVTENDKKPVKKIAVLCHGFTYAKYACLSYAEIYLKLGFTVIIYDHRNHGLSGKAYTTMGYYERFDLKKVIDWCYDTYGSDCMILTHGESMGAATVLMHLGIDNRVKCAIADCAYSDLIQLLKHQLHVYYHFPKCLIKVESLITYLRAGFWYKEVSPIKVVSNTDIPILFIHGKKDCYVPTDMSRQMYSCKKNKKAIYLVGKAKHAESCLVNRKGYEEKVRRFLKVFFENDVKL
ncbi:alpha/beta hydrolase [Mobilitalea sibirica]|uniref:Alpha/beta hydrolase n=1 Tax=Mobilitalea sibirica TaxID=1462919 RepID=A0A8J7HBM2_9FIRM|nr:alpha/beta hydrolase [Mobilitalea sibirica]MBH1941261.1 alpha/beta hydrolase [Mobilitalea sibirica]